VDNLVSKLSELGGFIYLWKFNNKKSGF
jgi:hypothetical protein